MKRTKTRDKIKRKCKCLGRDKMFGLKTYLCDDNKEYYFTTAGQPVVLAVRTER